MGRASTKENKNRYQLIREELGLSREKASELLDATVDQLIRKYGYRGRVHTLEQFEKEENEDLRNNMGAAAHLIHGSSDGRFTITYAVKNIAREEIEGVGFQSADYDEMVQRYDPEKLQYGYNTLPDGEEIYFIPNPALGLWINREKF